MSKPIESALESKSTKLSTLVAYKLREKYLHPLRLTLKSTICKSTMIQVTSSLVVTSDKVNTCSVYTQQAYLCAARVSVAPRSRDQSECKERRCNITTKLILTWSINCVTMHWRD